VLDSVATAVHNGVPRAEVGQGDDHAAATVDVALCVDGVSFVAWSAVAVVEVVEVTASLLLFATHVSRASRA